MIWLWPFVTLVLGSGVTLVVWRALEAWLAHQREMVGRVTALEREVAGLGEHASSARERCEELEKRQKAHTHHMDRIEARLGGPTVGLKK